MTSSTDEHPTETDDTVIDEDHMDSADQENADQDAQDHLDPHEDREASADPDYEAAHNSLADGPQGPRGRVEMAAAGIDVDGNFPTGEAEDQLGGGAGGDADGRLSEAFVEDGNRWRGDGSGSTAGQFLTPDPSHPESADLVVAADHEATPESAAAGLPDVHEPLLASEAEQTFLSRWNDIQIGFVEDPAQSVRDADGLIQDIAAAYTTAFNERSDSLAAAWHEGNPGTEELRLALKQYRTFIGVVLPE